ncbi:MAG TPA: hypothetical protein VMW95_02850 [Desulfobacterales bacterium]|nr:hypothetical protein [Desulfobacterales bacterium]
MFRAKCVRLARDESSVDQQLTIGKFYEVIETAVAMDNIEYWSVVGDIGGATVSRPSWCFSRALGRKNVNKAGKNR